MDEFEKACGVLIVSQGEQSIVLLTEEAAFT